MNEENRQQVERNRQVYATIFVVILVVAMIGLLAASSMGLLDKI